MSKSDLSTVWVNVFRSVRKSQFAQAGQRLRGEGLVEFDHIDFRKFPAQALHQLPGGGHGAEAHQPGLDASRCHSAEPAGAIPKNQKM